jgi:hypothetical protein
MNARNNCGTSAKSETLRSMRSRCDVAGTETQAAKPRDIIRKCCHNWWHFTFKGIKELLMFY